MPPAQLLQRLLRFDTTNPPGDEGPCLELLRQQFEGRGLEVRMLAALPDRPNLVVRVPGRGQAPPLLLQGHVDVVTAAKQSWRYPPFSGKLVDGWLWGRGALDMKGGVVMMVSALLRCLEEGRPPAGDVVLCCLSDEETGGIHGARFLVEKHPELFAGVRHGLGEGGGATQHIQGRPFYPIMAAEKRTCRLRAVLRGPGGHAARHHRGGTVAALAALLTRLDQARLPVHVTPIAEAFVRGVAAASVEPLPSQLRALLDPKLSDGALEALGVESSRFDSILHNTANATVVRAGDKVNVLPSEASVDLDGRLLPGFEPEQLIAEVRDLIGPAPEIRLLEVGPHLPEPELDGFFGLLCDTLQGLDSRAVPVPALMTGATDQRHFGQLGIRGYGYLPLRLPPEFGQETVHAADERVPVKALDFGVEALYRVLQRYRG
jgi:acetylornithine deacetylase/succinyl-diaminopimelate desuccinylase-like protein